MVSPLRALLVVVLVGHLNFSDCILLLLLLLLLLAAAKVGGGMLVTSTSQPLLLGPAHERMPNERHGY